MKTILQYFKLLSTKYYLYVGLLPWLLDFISTFFPEKYRFSIPFSFSLIWLIIAFFISSYHIWEEEQQKNKFPKIIIDYDLSNDNSIYLEIKNIGNDYAKNIKTKFTPNIKNLQNKKINDNNFLKNIFQLSPSKSVRFFFGTFFDDKYLQKFNIDIEYTNLDGLLKFKEKQILDFSSFIDSSPKINETNLILVGLNNISENLKSQNSTFKEINKVLKNGINIRNLDLNNYSLDEISIIFKNILMAGNNQDLWLYPYIYDTKQIVKVFRDKLLAKNKLSIKDKKILEQLNIINTDDKRFFESAVEELKKLYSERKN